MGTDRTTAEVEATTWGSRPAWPRRVRVLVGVGAIVAASACSGGGASTPAATTVVTAAPTEARAPSPVVVDVDGSAALAGAETSATTCPDESDGLIWASDDALRLLVLGAGADHAEEAADAAEAWAADAGVEVTSTSLGLYSAPVPGREIAGRIVGDPPPDAVEGFVGGVVTSCAQQGKVNDLTDLWRSEDLDAVVPPAIIDLATVDGQRMVVPTTVQWNPVWYRPDVFADTGLQPPQTWDDLLAACDTLAEAGVTPIALGTGNWLPPVARWFSHLDLGLNGPDFHLRLLAGLESWDDPRVADVFDHWEELLDRGCFGDEVASTTYAEMVESVASGEAGMLDLGSWIHESLEPEQSELLAPMPFPDLGADVPRSEIATVQGAFVPSETTRPDEAGDLVAALAGPDRLAEAAELLERTPVRLDVEAGEHAWAEVERAAMIETDHVVQLLEFTAEDQYAGVILGALSAFVNTPAERATLLARVEETRRDIFG